MRSKRCLFCLLDFVLPVENLMFSIANLMVDGGCIATTGGSSLFCIYICARSKGECKSTFVTFSRSHISILG
jgi:hypothetical protein